MNGILGRPFGRLIFLTIATTAMGARADDDTPWYRRALVGMEVGPTGAQFGSDPSDVGYAAKFDGREVVRRCAEANAEYVVIWARDGEYAYYDSRVVPRCPGLGDRDVLKEAVEEGKARKIPIIAYCGVQQGGRFLAEHPELAMRGPDGAVLGRYCLNAPGTLNLLRKLTSEMLAYGIAGFHIDMLDQGFGPPYGCWCDTCKGLFQAQYQHPMPPGPTWDEAWDHMLAFRYATSERFEKALREHIRQVAPAATVDFNYHGNPPFSWEVGQRPVQHARNGDFNTGETGVWGFSALGVGLNAAFYRAATPGQPVQVAIQRGVRMYHDQTTRPLDDIRWELFTLLAHGAFVTMVDKTAYDGGLDPVAYRRIGAAFREAQAKRPTFGHEPVEEVGLYFSSRTRDWYGRDDAPRSFQPFQGAHQAMVQEHLTWGVVLDENVDLATLRRHAVVMLPNVGIVSDREAELLRQYVTGGGRLIVTGLSGTMGARGEPLEHSALEDLIGARLVRRLDSRDNHVRLPAGGSADAEALRAGIEPDWPFLVEGPAVVYEPTTAQAIGQLHEPHRTVRQKQGKEGFDWPLSAGAAVGPAVLVNNVGQGRVLTFAASPDAATASEHRLVEARRLLAGAVRLLHPAPLLRIVAPAAVEAVVSRDGANSRLLVHLLAYWAPPATTPPRNRPYVLPGLIEDAPTYRVRLRLAAPPVSAAAGSDATILKRDGATLEAVVSDIHEVITIEP